MRASLKRVFVVQGEEKEAIPLAQKIRDEFAVEAEVPNAGESVVL
jgi:predicted metal-dependent RNase